MFFFLVPLALRDTFFCWVFAGSTSAKRISLLFKNSRCRSFSESWAFLSASSGVSPIDEREGLNNNNSCYGSSNIADINNSPSLTSSTLRLSPLRPADSDIDIDCDSTTSSPTLSAISTSSSSATASTKTAEPSSITATTEPAETTSSSLSELPPSSLNLFRQPAVTGATAYEDLPDQELLKTLAAFLRGDSSPSHKKGNRPSAATTSSSVRTYRIVTPTLFPAIFSLSLKLFLPVFVGILVSHYFTLHLLLGGGIVFLSLSLQFTSGRSGFPPPVSLFLTFPFLLSPIER